MSVSQVTQQLTDIQKAFAVFKEGYDTHFKKVYDLENHFMNAFEDFSAYIKTETAGLYDMLSKHTEMVNTVKNEHDKNKFEEGNFNRVSIIKKQDETIKTLEIKVAELEMRLASAEKVQHATTAEQAPKPVETHLCYARIGKAKYNISKQVPEFMDDFPMGSYVTKTGCVVGLACKNIVPHANVLFCPEHNNGKFEDIRTEPGSPQTTIVATVTTSEPLPEKKKASGRKKKDVPVEPSPHAVETSVLTPASAEPLHTASTEPSHPASAEPSHPASAEPLHTASTEPTQELKLPPLTISIGDEDTPDDVSPPMSPIVDITTIKQSVVTSSAKTDEPVEPPSSQTDNVEPSSSQTDNVEPPSFDDIEFYDEPSTGKTYYLDSKTKCIYEIAPNDEIGVFVKRI